MPAPLVPVLTLLAVWVLLSGIGLINTPGFRALSRVKVLPAPGIRTLSRSLRTLVFSLLWVVRPLLPLQPLLLRALAVLLLLPPALPRPRAALLSTGVSVVVPAGLVLLLVRARILALTPMPGTPSACKEILGGDGGGKDLR